MNSASGRFDFATGCIVTGFHDLAIGEGTSFMRDCRVYAHASKGVTIGRRCSFNHNVIVAASDGGTIEIGDDVLVGPNVVIRAADHRIDDVSVPIRQQGHVPGRINIESDVWLAANVVVTAGVRIGRGCVVGAGSVVTSDLPAFSICAGAPARLLRHR
jgi:galactoside O-acetyltransferase